MKKIIISICLVLGISTFPNISVFANEGNESGDNTQQLTDNISSSDSVQDEINNDLDIEIEEDIVEEITEIPEEIIEEDSYVAEEIDLVQEEALVDLEEVNEFNIETTSILLTEGTVYVKNNNELKNAVSNMTGDLTVMIDPDFTSTEQTITLNLNNNYKLIIDGGGIVFPSNLTITAGENNEVTVKNIVANTIPNGAAFRVGRQGTYNFDNISISNKISSSLGTTDGFSGVLNISNSEFINNKVQASGYSGGAITSKNLAGSIRITNSYFEGNQTARASSNGVGGQGGAVHISGMGDRAKFEVIDSIFIENKTGMDHTNGPTSTLDGGAIGIFNTSTNSKILIEGNTFEANEALDDGGAILIQTNSRTSNGISLSNNTFYKNKTHDADSRGYNGGAVQFYSNGSLFGGNQNKVSLYNNTFVGNSSGTTGGAVGAMGAPLNNRIKLEMFNNLFIDNTSEEAGSENIKIQGSVGASDSNVGVDDSGNNEVIAKEDVFGDLDIRLSANNSDRKAGTYNNPKAIKTVLIAPELLADANGVVQVGSPKFDQRGKIREANVGDKTGIGSVEINWLKYDANGGVFSLPELNPLNEMHYYKLDPNGNADYYYQIGNYGDETNIKESLNASRMEDNYPLIFKGWSETVLSPDIEPNLTDIILPNSSYVFSQNNETVYAVWAQAYIYERHVDVDGNELLPEILHKGGLNKPYETEEKDIPGYVLVSVEGDATGVLSEDAGEVKYVYILESLVPKPEPDMGRVVVSYVDKDNKTILDDFIMEGSVGEIYKVVIPSVKDYKYLSSVGLLDGTYTKDEIKITLIYESLVSVPVDKLPEEPKDKLPATGIGNHYAAYVSITIGVVLLGILKFKKESDFE